MSEKRELRVVETQTGKVEHSVDVTGKSDHMVERVLSGMLHRIDTDRFHVEDSADDKSKDDKLGPPVDKSIEELMANHRFAYYIPADGFIEGQGYRVSLVFEDVVGHYPTGSWPYDGTPDQRAPWFWGKTYEEAKQVCASQNFTDLKLTAEEALKIVTSSMFPKKPRRRRDAGRRRAES